MWSVQENQLRLTHCGSRQPLHSLLLSRSPDVLSHHAPSRTANSPPTALAALPPGSTLDSGHLPMNASCHQASCTETSEVTRKLLRTTATPEHECCPQGHCCPRPLSSHTHSHAEQCHITPYSLRTQPQVPLLKTDPAGALRVWGHRIQRPAYTLGRCDHFQPCSHPADAQTTHGPGASLPQDLGPRLSNNDTLQAQPSPTSSMSATEVSRRGQISTNEQPTSPILNTGRDCTSRGEPRVPPREHGTCGYVHVCTNMNMTLWAFIPSLYKDTSGEETS